MTIRSVSTVSIPPFSPPPTIKKAADTDISPTCVVEAAEAAAAAVAPSPVPIVDLPPLPNLKIAHIPSTNRYSISVDGFPIYCPSLTLLFPLSLEGHKPPNILFIRRTLHHPHLFHVRVQIQDKARDLYIETCAPPFTRYIKGELRNATLYFSYPPGEFNVESATKEVSQFQTEDFSPIGFFFNRHGIVLMGSNTKKEMRFFWLTPNKELWLEIDFSAPNSTTNMNRISSLYMYTTSEYVAKNVSLSFGNLSRSEMTNWFINGEYAKFC